jgi:hypothetical protein
MMYGVVDAGIRYIESFVVHDDVQEASGQALEWVGGPQHAVPGPAVLDENHPAGVQVVVSGDHGNSVAFH